MRQTALVKEIDIPRFIASAHAEEKAPEHRRSRRRWMTLLLFSFFVAAATGLTGIAIAAASLFRYAELVGGLSLLSPVLIATTFAALIFGAHCLDRIDGVDHAIRVAKLKEKLRDVSDTHSEDVTS